MKKKMATYSPGDLIRKLKSLNCELAVAESKHKRSVIKFNSLKTVNSNLRCAAKVKSKRQKRFKKRLDQIDQFIQKLQKKVNDFVKFSDEYIEMTSMSNSIIVSI